MHWLTAAFCGYCLLRDALLTCGCWYSAEWRNGRN